MKKIMIEEIHNNMISNANKARTDINIILKSRGYDLKFVNNNSSSNFIITILNIFKNKNN